jgi:hypothetical protein
MQGYLSIADISVWFGSFFLEVGLDVGFARGLTTVAIRGQDRSRASAISQ